MQQYHSLIQNVLEQGSEREDRTGVGTRALFGAQMRFDLNDGFPLLTTKRLHFRSIITELLWFLRGDTNIIYLHDHGVTIWDEWADSEGNLGPIYGQQWRSWQGTQGTIDQISLVVEQIKRYPHSRRHIVSAWNVEQIDHMALPPCHCLFQFFVQDNKLSTQLYQRSADLFLGVPFNIASYALLTHIIALATGLQIGEFIHTFGDVHLYHNHLPQARLLLDRAPRPLPELEILHPERAPFDFTIEDFVLHNYHPHNKIRAEIAV